MTATALVLAGVLAIVAAPARAHAADDATAQARSHYEMGLKLFDAREHEQALIEFSKANEIKSRPAALFMMAQCEYLMGRLKDASIHYQRYATENPDGEFAELARDRVESIAKRLSTFVVNTVPEDVTVRISPEAETGRVVASGQAPNNFQIPRGRYRVDVTKPNYQGQTRIVDIDVGETKPLFFKLDPIPARLEIETTPPGATLYVNGNRARNPYRQDVTPGHIEIFAEATDYDAKTVDLTLAPGERMLLTGGARLRLNYVQRSGRPELVVASSLLGGIVGAGAVVARHRRCAGEPERRVGAARGRRRVFRRRRGRAGRIGAVAPVHPRQPGALHPGRDVDRDGRGTHGRRRRAPGDDCARGDAVPARCGTPCRGSVSDQLRAGFVGALPGLTLG